MPLVAALDAVSKSFSAISALREVDLAVPEGGVFGVIGPNGAGKTTILAILQGCETPDAGRATVLGREAKALRRRERAQLGVQLESGGLPQNLRCLESLRFFARLYADRDDPRPPAGRFDPVELLERVGLEGSATQLIRELSTGQHRRLAVACALIGMPRLAFLDEPSLGLDPVGKRALWDLLRSAAGQGVTLLITTNAMDEAEALCDRIAFLQRGRIAALGSPRELIDRYAVVHRIQLDGEAEDGLTRHLEALPGVIEVRFEPPHTLLFTRDAIATLRALTAPGPSPVPRFQWIAPRLEDVFHQFENGGG